MTVATLVPEGHRKRSGINSLTTKGRKSRRIDADHGTGSAITHAVPSVAPDLVSFLVRKYLRRFQKMAVVFHDTHEILRDMLPREHHGLCLIANPRTGERWRQSWRSRTSCRE